MEHIGGALAKYEQIIREGFDPDIPPMALPRCPTSCYATPAVAGAKLCYAMLLSYAWQKDSCFPGQEALAKDLGISKRSRCAS